VSFRLFYFVFALISSATFTRAQSQSPSFPPLDAKTTAALDRTWRRHAARDPNTGARDLYEFLLTAVARGWHPEHWAELISLGEELHDRDPASPGYGNYRWYRREPKVNDRNAVEFSMQSASLTWRVYRDRLDEPARQQLAAALALGAEGMLRQKVDVSYTNIFLMRIANSILIGETLDRPDLVQRGRAWFDEWFAYTRANGIHEFNSPTYYGTDLTDLGALANYAQTAEVRDQATRALRLLWTDIAANWFEPYRGVAGAHSRDYGFLTGHGYLDQQLARAGWLDAKVVSEAHPAIDDVTFWQPPAELHESALHSVPRTIVQHWGPNAWERATHYVGRDFSLGSSGGGYGAQDKVLTLTLSGGPQMPLMNFSLEYRGDPYGQTKMGTADGHAKLTHLLPFITTVQRGTEALLVASYDPAKARNPAGGRAPIEYAHVWANFVVPTAATVFDAHGALAADATVPFAPRAPLFLRFGRTAAAIQFVAARDDSGHDPAPALVRDGSKVPAERFTAVLADGQPRQPIFALVWIRAAEGITTDEEFDGFRRAFLAAAEKTHFSNDKNLNVTVMGLAGPLRLVTDLEKERRLTADGGEPVPDDAVFTINGRDVAAALLGSTTGPR
jgi:hypothetical protein